VGAPVSGIASSTPAIERAIVLEKEASSLVGGEDAICESPQI
jgi:hypothetical protein